MKILSKFPLFNHNLKFLNPYDVYITGGQVTVKGNIPYLYFKI